MYKFNQHLQLGQWLPRIEPVIQKTSGICWSATAGGKLPQWSEVREAGKHPITYRAGSTTVSYRPKINSAGVEKLVNSIISKMMCDDLIVLDFIKGSTYNTVYE